jgi:ABC-type amino acid transport system permease subunit
MIILYNYIYIFKGLFLTLLITSISLIVGLFIGFLIGILIFIKYKLVDFFVNDYINNIFNKLPSFYEILNFYRRLTINTPIITQLFIVNCLIPFRINAFFIGLIVLGLNSAAHVSVIILESLNNISELEWNTSISLGFKPIDAIKKIFIKMIIINNKKRLFQEYISLLKESSVLAYFGVNEIISRSREVSLQSYNFLPYMLFVSGLYFFIISFSGYIYDKFFSKG